MMCDLTQQHACMHSTRIIKYDDDDDNNIIIIITIKIQMTVMVVDNRNHCMRLVQGKP